jgi:hypothetical protein
MKFCRFCGKDLLKKNKYKCYFCIKRYSLENYDVYYIRFFSFKEPSIETKYDYRNDYLLENENSVVLLFYTIHFAIILPLPIWKKSSYLVKKFEQKDFNQRDCFRYKVDGARMVLFEDIVGESFYEVFDLKNFHNWIKIFIYSSIENPLSEALCFQV